MASRELKFRFSITFKVSKEMKRFIDELSGNLKKIAQRSYVGSLRNTWIKTKSLNVRAFRLLIMARGLDRKAHALNTAK